MLYEVITPQAKGKEMPPAERIVITIKKDGKIYLEKTAVTIESLKTALSKKANKEVFLKADKDVPYGNVVTVMGDVITSYSIHYTKLYEQCIVVVLLAQKSRVDGNEHLGFLMAD